MKTSISPIRWSKSAVLEGQIFNNYILEYTLQYYLTRFNFSPVIPLLRADLGITNARAGGLMAFFFVTYTIFQLPAGYLGDRLGPRKILTFGALVSITGNLIFSQGSSYFVLAVGQLVNGMVFFSFGVVALAGMILAFFINEKKAE